MCYSVAEYCCPVLARSSYTNLIDTQDHSSMHLISGCLQPTQLSFLPVLSNVSPRSLRCKAATDNVLPLIEAHFHGLHLDAQYGQIWHLSTQLCSGERTGRRPLWSTSLILLPILLSDSQVSLSLIIHGLWWTVSRQVKAHVMLTCTNGVSPNHLLVIVSCDRPWTTLSTCAH